MYHCNKCKKFKDLINQINDIDRQIEQINQDRLFLKIKKNIKSNRELERNI